MARLIGRRLLATVPILLIVSFLVFGLIALVPGDAAVTLAGGQNATRERIAEVRDQLHLDEPFIAQYGRWLGDAVQGDLGTSLYSGEPVSDDIARKFPITLGLVLAAMVVALLLGTPLGVLSALRPGSWVDRGSRAGASLGLAIPGFWLAVELVALFAVTWKLLPPSGYEGITKDPVQWLRYITLPAVALGIVAAASLARQLRAALIDALDTQYARTAWAKGAPTRTVVLKHALKNAAIPAVTVLGLQFGFLIGGSVIIEEIFSIPGIGPYFIHAVTSFDVPVIQGVTLLFTFVAIGTSLLVDLSYGLLNPKVRVR
jgi:peptide/nickel transport system permease protein